MKEIDFVTVSKLYPMGAQTMAIACSLCKYHGEDKYEFERCNKCMCEVESGFEFDRTVRIVRKEETDETNTDSDIGAIGFYTNHGRSGSTGAE